MKRLLVLAAALLCATSARADLSGYPDEYSQRPLTLPSGVVSPQVQYGYLHVGTQCTLSSLCMAGYSVQTGALALGAGITDQVQFNLETSFLLEAPSSGSVSWQDHLTPGLSFLAVRSDAFQLAANVAVPLRMRGQGSLVDLIGFGLLGRVNASKLVFVDVTLDNAVTTSGTAALLSQLSGKVGFQITPALAAQAGAILFAMQTAGQFDSVVFGADFMQVSAELIGSLGNRVDLRAGITTDLKATSHGYAVTGGLAVRL